MSIGTGGSGGSAGNAGGSGTTSSLSYAATTVNSTGGGGGGGSIGTGNQDTLSGDGGANGLYSGGVNVWDGGGGGAGAGGVGTAGTDIGGQGGNGGAGGVGVVNNLLGSNIYYGGGGGGGGTPSANSSEVDGTGAAGGSGVGGTGGGTVSGVAGTLATAGAVNSGSGGGGGGWRSTYTDANRIGAAGAAGVIIFIYTKALATISSVTISSTSGADNTYAIGDVITARVIASEAITVTGSPNIPVGGLTSKFFTYSSGSGSTTLNFTYTVLLSDNAAAGISITANSLSLNSGTLKSGSDLALDLTHSAIAASTTQKVDGIRPTVTYTASTNVAENETASVRATLSETGTLTLSGGYDRAHITWDSATGTFNFAAHDFENPQDTDGNNQYLVGFTIADANGNAGSGSFNIFFTVTNVAEVAQVGAPSLSASAVKGISVTITVTTNIEGKFTFYANDKKIAGCINKSTTGSSPNFSSTCNWKPAVRATVRLYATFKPTRGAYTNANSALISVLPETRSGSR